MSTKNLFRNVEILFKKFRQSYSFFFLIEENKFLKILARFTKKEPMYVPQNRVNLGPFRQVDMDDID